MFLAVLALWAGANSQKVLSADGSLICTKISCSCVDCGLDKTQWTKHQLMTWCPKSSQIMGNSSSLDSQPLRSSSRLRDLGFRMKCKSYFVWKLWTTEQRSSSPRSDTSDVAPGSGVTWHQEYHTCSRFPAHVWAWWLLMHWLSPPLLNQELGKLPQVLESAWLDKSAQGCSHPCRLGSFSSCVFPLQSTFCFGNPNPFPSLWLELLSVLCISNIWNSLFVTTMNFSVIL